MVNDKSDVQISLQKPAVTDHSGGGPEAETRGHSKMEAKAIDAFFGKTHALRKVSLAIPEKQVTAIIGPSGCGKSTFLRCLNRLHEVAHGTMTGEIELGGQSIFDYDPVLLRRRVGMVFQKPNPFPTMSVFDNVAFGLRLNGVATRSWSPTRWRRACGRRAVG